MSTVYEFDDDPTTGPITADPAQEENTPAEDARPLYFPSAEQWVQNWLLPRYRRKLSGDRCWDPE